MAEHLLPIVLLYLFHTPTQALPPPKLVVDKQLISETDSVTLDCQAPSYLPVFHCYFPIMVTNNSMGKQCRRTVTGGELLWRSQQTPPAVVQLECFYTVMVGDVNSLSPHSNISITIQGVLQTTRSAASTLGPSALGSTRRPSTSTSPPPTSDGASEVPATLTPWLPTQAQTQTQAQAQTQAQTQTQTQTQTQAQTQAQTQGKGSGPFHPASSWSPAGWTLAHTDGFLTGGAASDERDEEPKNKGRLIAIMVIAVASFGVIVGVILLALTLRTVSERRRRSEHQNVEDEYHMYSTITELAPSVKNNVIYSKVEAH